MKKKLLFLLFFGLINANLFVFAQRDDRRRAESEERRVEIEQRRAESEQKRRAEIEELNKKRVEFFTKAMELTRDEAKVFWPLYDELQAKKFRLNQQFSRALSEFRGNERERRRRSENEYRRIVNLSTQFRLNEAKLDEEYIAKFAKIISYEKIYRYQQAELQFARQMLNQRREGDAQRSR